MNIHLNYHHLRYFLAVANHGGIKAASDQLHVSPPTLSTQIHDLEDYLGQKLFERQGRRLVLSATGRLVRRYAERIFDLGSEMVEVVGRGAPEGPETVLLGAVDAVPKLFVSQLLSRAWEAIPNLRIVVREGLPGELFPALASHQVDLVLANEPPPSSLKALLHSRRAGRFRVSLAATPELRARFRKSEGLTGFPVLVPARESPLRRELETWWSENGLRPEVKAEFDDAAAMYELAAAGIGAAPVFDAVFDRVAERYGLVPLPLRTGIYEELHVVSGDRQFSHEGPRLIARLAREISGGA